MIQDGKILTREMVKNRFTVDELMEELRMAGVTDLSTVKYAVLETTGRISVLPYAEHQPVTVRDMGLKVKEAGLPVIVVSDGRVLSHNLKTRNLSMRWVKEQMGSQGRSGHPPGVSDDRGRSRQCIFCQEGGENLRQLWISVAILAGMVLLLSWNMVHVHQLTEPMREDLSQAVCSGAGGGLAEGRGTDPKGTGALAE